ncbi:hypothetical protein K438DRAFT_1945988 [Mycena galopus ATCC 62051]|nr:hypothetical protein K438DRAFT_1945988 [Mycena galopus ATCC 62051]
MARGFHKPFRLGTNRLHDGQAGGIVATRTSFWIRSDYVVIFAVLPYILGVFWGIIFWTSSISGLVNVWNTKRQALRDSSILARTSRLTPFPDASLDPNHRIIYDGRGRDYAMLRGPNAVPSLPRSIQLWVGRGADAAVGGSISVGPWRDGARIVDNDIPSAPPQVWNSAMGHGRRGGFIVNLSDTGRRSRAADLPTGDSAENPKRVYNSWRQVYRPARLENLEAVIIFFSANTLARSMCMAGFSASSNSDMSDPEDELLQGFFQSGFVEEKNDLRGKNCSVLLMH